MPIVHPDQQTSAYLEGRHNSNGSAARAEAYTTLTSMSVLKLPRMDTHAATRSTAETIHLAREIYTNYTWNGGSAAYVADLTIQKTSTAKIGQNQERDAAMEGVTILIDSMLGNATQDSTLGNVLNADSSTIACIKRNV